MEVEKLEDLTDVTGNFGRWQCLYFLSLVYIYGVTGWPSLGMAFLAPQLNFTCVTPNGTDFDYEITEDSCNYYGVNSTGARITEDYECNEFLYDTSFWTNSFTQKFDLVCGRQYLISLSNSLHHVGDIVASLYLSYLADRFGRRPVLLLAIIPALTACFMAQFSPNMAVFLIAKALYGMSGMSLASVGFVLMMEITGVQIRGVLGIAVEFGWVTFYVALPGLAYLLHDSMYIQLAITVGYLFLLLLYFTVPESPRWLMLHNKSEKAEKVIEEALKVNKKPKQDVKAIVAHLSSNIKSPEVESDRKYSLLDLFRSSQLRKRTIILYIYWFVNGFVYYGISLNADLFGGSVFLNFFLFGVVEFPAYAVFSYVLKRFGRLWPLGLTVGLAGVFCLVEGLVPSETYIIRIILTVLGKFFIAASFALAYPYTTEAYPTAVRSIGLGSCSTSARIAATIAPFSKELQGVIGLPAVMSLFGAMGVFTGLLVYWLPETKGKNLTDTLIQAEEMGN